MIIFFDPLQNFFEFFELHGRAVFAENADDALVGFAPVRTVKHRIGATADTCHFKGVGITCLEYGPGFIPIWPMWDERIEVAQVITATKVLALASEALVATQI